MEVGDGVAMLKLWLLFVGDGVGMLVYVLFGDGFGMLKLLLLFAVGEDMGIPKLLA